MSPNPDQKNVPPGTAGPIFTNPSMNKAVCCMDNFCCLAILFESSNEVAGNDLCRAAFYLVALYHVHKLSVFK